MAEKVSVNKPKDLVEATPEELAKIDKSIPAAEKEELPIPITRENMRENRAAMEAERQKQAIASWVPKTELGRMVKTGKIVIGDKEKSMWLYPKKKIFTNEISSILNEPFNKDFAKRRVPYLTGKTQVKRLYNTITGRKLD